MIASLLGFALLCASLVGLFLPLRIWDELRRGAGAASAPAPAAMLTALGAELRRARSEPGFARAFAWVGLPLLFVLCLIPFGGVYTSGAGELALVPLDLDWGMQAVLAGLACAAFAAVAVRGFVPPEPLAPPALSLLRVAALATVFALSWVGIFMLASSLRPVEIVRFQDQTTALLGLPLPAWGVILQPVAFAIQLACLVALRSPTASGSPRLVEESLALPILSMLTVTLFFGGGSLPYASSEMLASQFAGPAGTTIAALVHVGVFLGKSALLLFLWLRVRERLPRLTDARALALCWKLLIPLALLNLLVTGAVILRQAEGSPT